MENSGTNFTSYTCYPLMTPSITIAVIYFSSLILFMTLGYRLYKQIKAKQPYQTSLLSYCFNTGMVFFAFAHIIVLCMMVIDLVFSNTNNTMPYCPSDYNDMLFKIGLAVSILYVCYRGFRHLKPKNIKSPPSISFKKDIILTLLTGIAIFSLPLLIEIAASKLLFTTDIVELNNIDFSKQNI